MFDLEFNDELFISSLNGIDDSFSDLNDSDFSGVRGDECGGISRDDCA